MFLLEFRLENLLGLFLDGQLGRGVVVVDHGRLRLVVDLLPLHEVLQLRLDCVVVFVGLQFLLVLQRLCALVVSFLVGGSALEVELHLVEHLEFGEGLVPFGVFHEGLLVRQKSLLRELVDGGLALLVFLFVEFLSLWR